MKIKFVFIALLVSSCGLIGVSSAELELVRCNSVGPKTVKAICADGSETTDLSNPCSAVGGVDYYLCKP